MADEDPEVIRRQMEVQRASLAEKLETLENKIVRTVDEAREAVAETVQTVKDSVTSSVETVKDTVQSSVDSVKETLDVRLQVERHPWPMFVGSIAVGFAAGWALNRATNASRPANAAWGHPASYLEPGAAASYAGTPASVAPPSEPPRFASSPPPPGHSWVGDLAKTFAPEMQKLKGFAIGAALGLVRDLLTQSVPEHLRSQFNDVIDNVTTKLGGEPVRTNVIDELLPKRAEQNGHQRPSERANI